jgi:hypothetical protein
MPVTRLLALGNDILADDAFGIRVAGEARRLFGGQIDVVESPKPAWRCSITCRTATSSLSWIRW